MSAAAPEVTVVIPTRDRWQLLSAHALPSALRQEDVAVEVVVVDDRSTDGTPKRIAERGDDRVTVLVNDGPHGAAAARNRGIGAARAPWVAFLDDDDLWSPRKLRAQLDAVGDADWSYTGVVVVGERLEPIDVLPVPSPIGLAEALRHGNVVSGGGSSVMARTSVLRELGGFDESLFYVEDWDLWYRLAQRAAAAACDEVLVATREHAERALFRDRRAVQRGIARLLARNGGTRADRLAAAEWLANQHVRAGFPLAAARLYARAGLAHRSPGNLLAAVGALFGERGLRGISRLLSRLGRESHLDLARTAPPSTPEWLEELRA